MRDYEQQIYQLAGEEFNIGSPKQIGDILFGKLGAKGKKTPTGAWQTGADILEDLAAEGNELSARILDWRALSKLKSTYTDALLALLDKNERVHTTYNQINTSTGRLASNNPNLQNIPIRSEEGKKIRECFIARPGCKLIASDYSQVELRLLAVVADVKGLKHSFAENQDIHAATASRVFGVPLDKVTPNQRRHAKAINFGIVTAFPNTALPNKSMSAMKRPKLILTPISAKCPRLKNIWTTPFSLPAKTAMFLPRLAANAP